MDFKISQLRLLAQIQQTGSLSQAAQNLGMTVSAASRTLKKLQEELNDILFIRTWRGMVPTERIRELMPTIRNLLDQLDLLEQIEVFDPAKLQMTLTIGSADNGIISILVPVIQHLSHTAPGITFRIRQLGSHQFEQLASGELDFLLYPTRDCPELPPHFHALTLFQVERSILVASDHPLAQAYRSGLPLTDAWLAEFPRVVVRLTDSSRSSIFNVRIRTETQGPAAVEVPYFLGAPYFLEGTLNTLALPRRTADFFAERMRGLTAIPWTDSGAINHTRLIWHERTDRSTPMQWIRSMFREHAGAKS